MIAIIDYGVGNLFSLQSSCKYIGQEAVVTADPALIEAADQIILPGVGAYEDAAKKLRESGMADIVTAQAKAGKPLMGICLGMQLLLEKSYEYGEHEGLGLGAEPLFKYIKEGDHVYFVHSYYATDCADSTIAVTEYGAELTAAVADGNVYGCQFHPEKSGAVGLKILQAFCEL